MPIIEVGNSYSQIKGLTSAQHRALKGELSYIENPESAFYSGGFQRKKSLLDRRGFFPSGLLHRVKAFFKGHEVKVIRYKDSRLTPKQLREYRLKFTPYKAQEHAVGTALGHQRGIISMPTGTGKSVVIVLLIARLNVRTLVVVPTLEIKKQLSQTILEAFGSMHNIVVENIDSSALASHTNFQALIIDEAHHVAASTYYKLNKTAWNDIYYRYMFTATPFRNQKNEQLLFEGIAGEVIFELSYKKAVLEKMIVPIEAYYIDLPKSDTEGYKWNSVYGELVTKNEHRNNVIATLLSDLHASGASTLCLVKEVSHGSAISAICGAAFVNGKDESSRIFIDAFNNKKLTTLIGTTGILGEGVDTKPCEYVIIAGLGKAKSAFMQQVGRAVRNYPGKESAKVIIFRDTSHKWTLLHFNTQKKILLDEYGVKVLPLYL